MTGPQTVRVAAARLVVTPDREMALGGSSVVSTGVSEPLEVNIAVLLAEHDHDPVVLVSVDSLYPGRILRAALTEALAPLDQSRLWVFASHTHGAPMLDDTKPGLGRIDESHLRELTGRVVTACLRLTREVRASEPCELVLAGGVADHSVNRRLMTAKGVKLAPNPGGPRDEQVTVLLARNQAGRPRFVLWNYACHPVAHPDPSMVSAHFPHIVRETLRASWQDTTLPVLFLQGFSGDTRPSASGGAQTARQRVRDVLVGSRFHDMSRTSYQRWSSSLASVVLATASRARPLRGSQIRTARIDRDASDFVTAAMPLEPVSFYGVAIGTDLTILGVSAEVVCEFALEMRSRRPGTSLMLGSCIDSPFGYAPTAKMLSEGGYEAGGYCRFFGLAGINHSIADGIVSGLTDTDRAVSADREPSR